jgi:hypothetical protein
MMREGKQIILLWAAGSAVGAQGLSRGKFLDDEGLSEETAGAKNVH